MRYKTEMWICNLDVLLGEREPSKRCNDVNDICLDTLESSDSVEATSSVRLITTGICWRGNWSERHSY